jgi:hypothetical protein
MDYLEFNSRVTSHIPDKGQVMVRYHGLYANARIYRSSEFPDSLLWALYSNLNSAARQRSWHENRRRRR